MENFYIMEKMAEEKVKELEQWFYHGGEEEGDARGLSIVHWFKGITLIKRKSDCCEACC